MNAENMKHLTIAQIISYGDPALKDGAREQVAKHMDSCVDCRSKYISIYSLRTAIQQSPPAIIPHKLTDSCIPEELMGDFMGHRLQNNEQDQFSSHVSDCDICFERAAYLSWSAQRMTAGVLNMEPTPEHFKRAVLPHKAPVTISSPSVWAGLRRWASSPVPAYAMAASLMFFMLIGGSGGTGGIIELKGDNSFTLYEQAAHAGPSFGFSDAGRQVAQVDAGLSVEKLSDGEVRFEWNKIEGAGEYSFTLSEIIPSGLKDIFETKSSRATATAPADIFSGGRAYRWKVSGSNNNQEVFVAQGQFALGE